MSALSDAGSTAPAVQARTDRHGAQPGDNPFTKAHGVAHWFQWLIAIATLTAVIMAVVHASEGQEFLRLARKIQPGWLLVALALQSLGYLAEGEIWRSVSRKAFFPLPLGVAYRFSLAKLFVDQAIPSAGVGGTAMVARALEHRGMSRSAVMAGVVVHLISYYAAYIVGLTVALLVVVVKDQISPAFALVAISFASFAAVLIAAALALAGRGAGRRLDRLAHFTPLRNAIALIGQADRSLTRSTPLLLRATLCQFMIFALDAATMWVLILALGTNSTPTGVFASFMISSVLRTISVLPAGLGAFEAGSVLTLKMIGVPLSVALSATLLFRGLSFWLPMAPGFWCSRSMLSPGAHALEPLDRP